MNSRIVVFVDSDVIISSLLSEKGASYDLLATKDLDLNISNYSQVELMRVSEKLNIQKQKVEKLLTNFTIVNLEDISAIKSHYQDFTLDINDTHIVAGSTEANAKFLITYNLKDYKTERIKAVLNISVMTPGKFLQYLRSIQ